MPLARLHATFWWQLFAGMLIRGSIDSAMQNGAYYNQKFRFWLLGGRDYYIVVAYLVSLVSIFTPYIRLVKFQLVRQIPDVYVGACVLAGKLFCCILHRIPKLFMV